MISDGDFSFDTLASIGELVGEIRASFMSFGHPWNEFRASSNWTKVEIRASLDEISPPRLAMCRRFHQKFCNLDKDTHQITKTCNYHPFNTGNNDGIILGKFLPSEASAMLGCPKLEFRAPVGALWQCWNWNRQQTENPELKPITNRQHTDHKPTQIRISKYAKLTINRHLFRKWLSFLTHVYASADRNECVDDNDNKYLYFVNAE